MRLKELLAERERLVVGGTVVGEPSQIDAATAQSCRAELDKVLPNGSTVERKQFVRI